MNKICGLYFFLTAFVWQGQCFSQGSNWFFNFTTVDTGYNLYNLPQSLYKGSQTFVQIICEPPHNVDTRISLEIAIVPLACWDYADAVKQAQELIRSSQYSNSSLIFKLSKTFKCDDHIIIDGAPLNQDEKSLHKTLHPVYTIPHDGFYIISFQVASNSSGAQLKVHLEMRSSYGYLSAADWPLLPFYGFMCVFYVFLGIMWLVFSFMQWRDLLRVQFWIGGVILLGMLEKATFYAEYQSINNTGVRVQGAMLFAEWVSCAKRTLARMLVIIVSLGFGIVKPRLGATLHRVVGVGLLYFFLACSEAYLRIVHPKNDQRDLLVASVPLAVLDSAICWWIFSALVNTTRTLKLRRNEVKLSLYRHFTNTLIFSLVASVVFMLYSIKTHRLVSCLSVWKDLWLDEAYWHILFSCILLVIMILWRPTNNNQRYAFVPLLDTEDDEEEAQLVNDAYGVKVRVNHNANKNLLKREKSVEDDLEWLQEHIKSEPTLSILDSDEEIVNTRFEVSKMQ
ncbi:transmembrane protein 87A [Coccinella septempunctata]|uniref:transmembrane protein 87A n=1 Tax=Coccinella septempunctata TaxID=41139 RepID=UPI001D07E162|nr:transmembrane protein 87A [Coccinella septempunctata]